MQACIQSFLEAFSLFLVFSVQTKPYKMLHLNVSHSEQQQQQQQKNMLKYTFLMQTGLIIFVFCRLNSFNSFVHETDKKLHCLGIPRGLQLTFIHSVMDLRK